VVKPAIPAPIMVIFIVPPKFINVDPSQGDKAKSVPFSE